MNGVDLLAWLGPMSLPALPPIRLFGWTALELDPISLNDLRPSGMTTHVNKVHHVTTINRVAQDLGVDEDWLWNVTNDRGRRDLALVITKRARMPNMSLIAVAVLVPPKRRAGAVRSAASVELFRASRIY
jgi:hypothetical protein